jgi:putative ABC transport system permease protein
MEIVPAGKRPPKLLLRFFWWYCHPKMQDYIEGDLMEVYERRVKAVGKRKADIRFVIDVLLLFRPGIIRPFINFKNANEADMLANYLKVGIRNILKYKVYSSINIVGLAIGLAATLVIALYISDELSYDRFLKNADRIYRIGSSGRFEGSEFRQAVASPPVAGALLHEVPEVEGATRFGQWQTMPVRYEDKSLMEKGMLVADSNFFQFFSFPLISGDPASVLKGTNKLVITETAAKRYFGDADPVGKILLRGEDRIPTEITGVAKDPPSNSHLNFEMILSGESWPYLQNEHWSNTFVYCYIRISPGSNPQAVKAKLDAITEKYLGPELEKIMGLSPEQFKANGNQFGFFLQPMLDIHLKSDLTSEIKPQGNIRYVYVFGAIAVFILLIACINFMNLSTARSATRAKEVGVRKSVGALRAMLIRQFLSESMIYSFVSTLLALGIIGLVLEPFNVLAGKDLRLSFFAQPVIIVGIAGFTLLIGLIAGSYPAFYLTAFRPMDVLKGRVGVGHRKSGLRNSLVVFQFMISIALILGSMVVYKQLEYMQAKHLGFDKENVIDLHNGWSIGNKMQEFKNELALHPEFRSAGFVSALPPDIRDGNLFRKGGTEQDIVLNLFTSDYDLLSAMGYEMAQGRFFSPDFPSDSTAFILNETAYDQLGYDGLEGQTVLNFNAETPVPFNLIGVIKDFNFENLRTTVKPMAILLNAGRNNYMVRQSNDRVAIRIAPGNAAKAIDKLEGIWKKYSGSPFEYTFLDQDIDAMFRSEQRMSRIIFIFATLTIVIACLGLFGLATYTGEQRSKEISIRKVLGASLAQVVGLLIRDFAVLIGIAFVIAAPLGWYLMSSWLQEFAYRIQVDWWMVLIAGLAAFSVAILTIGYQSLRTARENPVNALKNE